MTEETKQHHAWCIYREFMYDGKLPVSECEQCAELWERFPYDPSQRSAPPDPRRVEICKKAGRAGGVARAKALSPERRKEIAKMGQAASQKGESRQ
jgi:hypothetical protein